MSNSRQPEFPEPEKTRQLVSALLKKKGINIQQKEAISARPVFSPTPASFAQQRLWLLEKMAPGNRYNIQVALRLKGPLDLPSLNNAWQEILKRHEILRTTFGLVDDQIMQFISPEPQSTLRLFDLTADAAPKREEKSRQILGVQAQEAFDLANGPLVRPAIIQVEAEDYILSLTMHHIIADGWSLVVLVRELTELYAALSERRPHRLHPLMIQYADFAWWQRQRLTGEFLAEQLGFWRKQLAGAPTPDLPTDHARPRKEEFRGAHHHFLIPEEIAERLRDLGRRSHASLFMALLAAWQVLLYRYSSQRDVVVGTPIANRTRVEIESLIGFFVNTLVLRTDVDGNAHFEEILFRTRRATLDAYEHQDVPYDKLVAELQPERTAGQSPFFATLLNWVNMPEANLELAQIQCEFVQSVPLENPSTKFDLSLNVVERGGALPVSLEYSTELYERSTIARMSHHLQHLLAAIATNADQPVGQLPLLDEAERNQILSEWNRTQRAYPAYATVVELLEMQAQRIPENPAVVFEGKSLSYRELHQRTNQLARFLKKLGVGPEVLVGICMERSEELVVALLGIMKAGGAYVPLDPSNPAERLLYLLNDAQPAVVLTQNSLRQILPKVVAPIICLDDAWSILATNIESSPVRTAERDNAAYVIYTSGSTGVPKGVVVQHGSLLNYLLWVKESLLDGSVDCLPAITSLGFDASLKQILGPLLVGGTVYMLAEYLTDLRKIFGLVSSKTRVALNCVPSFWRQLVEDMEKNSDDAPRNLVQLWLGGESFTPDLIERSLRVLPDLKISNLYGPTEATANAIHAERISPEQIYIGKPIANTKAFVLDPHLEPVSVGVTGELYIGGEALARGYWRQADLTAERFIPDPFTSRAGERLYRTGDLTRWREDGQIEYVGRSDHQVKLRGFRIELGEIETVLAQHEAVQQAVVVVQGTEQEKKLVAYVVPAAGAQLSLAALRSYVQEKLPEYMVPAAIVELAELPLSAHGKVNRKALPQWEFTAAEGKYQPPRTPTEELLAGIWSEVLGVERIGIHDNFFELGGHSLSAMQVTSRLRSALQVELPFSAIFQAPAVHSLAAQIESVRRNRTGQDLPPLLSGNTSESHPLSFAQQRLWFMDRLHPESTFYNISGAVRLLGELEVTALEQALATVAERHQVFRTRFVLKNEDPAQVVEKDARLALEHEDLRPLTPEERDNRLRERITAEYRKPFNLNRAPLARAILLRIGEKEHVLFVSMHHIVCDGWSINLLIRELTELYAAFNQGRPSSLPDLPVQYVDYARWQHEYLQGLVLERHLSYWRLQLSNAPALNLPTDRLRPAQESFLGAYYGFVVPLELTAGLKNLARSQSSTLFMVLLAAWETLLYRYSGQADLTLGMPVANRSLPETEGLIGFFVNTLVLRSNLECTPDFIQVLQQMKEITLGAYDHQDLPFEKLVADLRPERSLSQTPLFRVMFNWVNTPPASLKFSGITWEPVPQEHLTANFDLTLTAGEHEGSLRAGFEYSTDLYDEPTIAQMAKHFLMILGAITRNPESRIATMPLLTDQEREQLLLQWNQTGVDLGHMVCVHQLIESQSRQTPDGIAIIADGELITYAELDQRASQIAHWLQSRGVGVETRVGVCLGRSAKMVVVLLGILKAGGAYVPLDPSYPLARLRYMVEDSGLKLLLTETSLRNHLSSLRVECVYLDSLTKALDHPRTLVPGAITPANAAYIIYTSGSTGRSKGVIGLHSSVVNQVLWMKAAFNLSSSDRVIHKASASFDASIAEIFAPLAAGAQVIVAGPEAHRNIDSLIRTIKDREVTFIDLPPTLLRALLEHPEIKQCTGLRHVVSGGEALAADLQAQATTLLSAQIYNTYGPTETTVQSTFWVCSAEPHTRSVPIGRPIANTRLYVLDSNGEPTPIGVDGELCIGGAGLTRGYLNRPALTADKFVPDPFSPMAGDRLYKTGDRVRWRRDGALEFLGRIDDQVKVRGFRIEPGEIESTMLAHPQVREAAVVVQDGSGNGKNLVAFVALEKDAQTQVQELRQYAKDLLPFYMRPNHYLLMEQLPLNANGKIDRNSLGQMQLPDETRKDIVPRTATEKILCRIWADVLKREEVGVEDDFFALGGHSLLAVNLVAQIARLLGRDVALDKIFEHSTPRQMARWISDKNWGHERSALVCMNKGLDQSLPLFLTYPIGGNVLCYSDLARFINRDKPFYALQALPDEGPQPRTLEEIAASCLRSIQQRHRGGNYHLGGWSFGGMLAFEMAHQATAAGDPPAALYLIDPPVLEDLPDEPPEEEMTGLFLLTLIADFSGGKSMNLEELKKNFDPKNDSLEVYLQKAVELGLLPAGTDPLLHNQSFKSFKRNIRAAHLYRPRKYSGKTLLVLREMGHSESWTRLLPENTSIIRVAGNHFTMLRGSNAATIAKLLE